MIQTSPSHLLRNLSLLTALFALISCDLLNEPKPPTWTNKLEFPLLNETVDLKDLEGQDNISSQLYGPNGERTIYAYSDTTEMASQEVGDQLAFGDINQSFAQSVDDVTVTGSQINETSLFDPVSVEPIEKLVESTLGPIELADIPATSTDPFQLDEIFPGVNDLPDGDVVVPGGPLEPVYKSFQFSDFSSADFSAGTLSITINNEMVIPLGAPITIELRQIVGVDTVLIPGCTIVWNTAIPDGSSDTQTLDLAGKTLPGQIFVRVSGQSNGSNGNTVEIDATARTSSFNVDISGSGLQVSSATAKVPSQTIDENGSIDLADSENKIEDARISTGTLNISVNNAMQLESNLVLTIQSLTDDADVPFTKTIPISANGLTSDDSDIAGYSLAMTVDQQVVNYSYQIQTIDTQDDQIVVAETDQISVTISLYGESAGAEIFFDEITGIIEPQLIEEEGDIDVSSDSKLLTADISNGNINIDIINSINKPGFAGLPTIVLTIPELLDDNNDPLSETLTLEPAPTTNNMSLDLSNYRLVFPDTATQVLTYTTVVTTPSGEVGQYGLEDSIVVDIVVSDMEFATVTGYFNQDAIVTEDQIVLDEGTKLIEANFETGDMILTMTNRIGVVADVSFQIDEFIRKDNGDTLKVDFRLEEVSTPQTSQVDLSDYKLAFDPGSVSAGSEQSINYTSRVTLPSDEQMTLEFGDSILIDVNISNLSMESVEGIIEPDTLTIDPDTVTFNMPEMVEDLMFENVNISIDFNSTFDVPITLFLELSGTDSLGNTERITVDHNLTPLDDVVHIDAAPLLNIHPESIISSGYAIISDGTTTSTIAKGQSMSPVMYINVPLSLIIEDPPSIDIDVSSIDALDVSVVSLERFYLSSDIVNMFEFGAQVIILASNDSLAFDSLAQAAGTAPAADTLTTLEILPLENDGIADPVPTTVELGAEKLDMFNDKLFIKPEVTLLGRTDTAGDPIPSRFFTTDSLTIRTWGSISYTVKGEEL